MAPLCELAMRRAVRANDKSAPQNLNKDYESSFEALVP